MDPDREVIFELILGPHRLERLLAKVLFEVRQLDIVTRDEGVGRERHFLDFDRIEKIERKHHHLKVMVVIGTKPDYLERQIDFGIGFNDHNVTAYFTSI